MKKDGNATIRVEEEDEDEEEEDLVGLVMDDDDRLQGLFHDGHDGGDEEEKESNDIEVNTSGNDSRKKRRLEKRKQILIQENSILDCFRLAVASHNATNSHQPSIIQQNGDVDGVQTKSNCTNNSESFRWRPPLLYALTETDTKDAGSAAGTLADWQPQPLELPRWALALVRPSNEALLNKQQDEQE